MASDSLTVIVGLDGLASHGLSGLTGIVGYGFAWIVELDVEKQKKLMPGGWRAQSKWRTILHITCIR